MSPVQSLYRFLEIFEFAARWVNALQFDTATHVHIQIRGIQDRTLSLGGKYGWNRCGSASSEDIFEWQRDFSSGALIGSTHANSLAAAASLFELFGWDNKDQLIQQIQSELLPR